MLPWLVIILCCIENAYAHNGSHAWRRNALQLEKTPPPSTQGCPANEPCQGDVVQQDFVPGDIVQPGDDDKVLVFVSFSMPEASLKALSDEAQQHKAVLIMRGLHEDSFVQTATRLHKIGVTVDIHPELFETYGIDRVPVFIKIRKGQEVARLSGNVSLGFAVSKLDAAS